MNIIYEISFHLSSPVFTVGEIKNFLRKSARRDLAVTLFICYTRKMRNKTVSLICEICRKCFHPLYRRRSERQQTVCSQSCEKTRRWGKTPINLCRTCDKNISNTGKRTQKFCSLECRAIWQSATNRGIAHPRFKGKIAYGTKGGYWAVLSPHHPYADGKGYVMEHRLIMEKHFGRFLKPEEVIHHVDENPRNNVIENLRLMAKKDHDQLHSISRWTRRKAAKHPVGDA